MSTEKTMDHADTCGATYTPRPWTAGEADQFGDFTIQREGKGLAIAAVTNGEMRRLCGEWGEHTANARLIAAAPELVEALKHLLDTMEGPSRTSLEDIEIAICAGRAVLSKALGTPGSGPGGER